MKDKDIVRQWSQSAPYWEKHRDTIRTMFAPITRALVEDARIAKGMNVLDVATGPGEPALSLIEIVGAEGRVQGVDPAPEMVAAAGRAAKRLGFNNAHFEVAYADQLSFPSD